MKVKLNKQLIIEGEHLQAFLDGVNEAASHGTPGVPTLTDSYHKIMSDIAKSKQNTIMTHAQSKFVNTHTGDQLMNPNYKGKQ
jgi:hypothetical protein